VKAVVRVVGLDTEAGAVAVGPDCPERRSRAADPVATLEVLVGPAGPDQQDAPLHRVFTGVRDIERK
jgi:hypothetical protein